MAVLKSEEIERRLRALNEHPTIGEAAASIGIERRALAHFANAHGILHGHFRLSKAEVARRKAVVNSSTSWKEVSERLGIEAKNAGGITGARLRCWACPNLSDGSVVYGAGGTFGAKPACARHGKKHPPRTGTLAERLACSITHQTETDVLMELARIESAKDWKFDYRAVARRTELLRTLKESNDPDNPFADPAFLAKVLAPPEPEERGSRVGDVACPNGCGYIARPGSNASHSQGTVTRRHLLHCPLRPKVLAPTPTA